MAAIKSALESIRDSVSSLGSSSPILSISFDPDHRLKLVEVPNSATSSEDNDAAPETKFIPVYSSGNDIAGHFDVILPSNMREYDYEEIAMYLVGHVLCPELDQDSVFLSHRITLSNGSGKLAKNESFDFKFSPPSLPMDSFYGCAVKCRYFVRAVIKRKGFKSNIKIDQDFMVQNLQRMKEPKRVQMQVGVDDCLHIKFEYDNVNISTKGCLEGHVKILSNTLKITTMQIQLIRRECIKVAEPMKSEIVNTSVLGKYEVMDGYPGNGEIIPIRMFLGRFKIITNTQVNEHFSVRYYVNLGLIDSDGRRYFKTCEIHLIRTHIE